MNDYITERRLDSLRAAGVARLTDRQRTKYQRGHKSALINKKASDSVIASTESIGSITTLTPLTNQGLINRLSIETFGDLSLIELYRFFKNKEFFPNLELSEGLRYSQGSDPFRLLSTAGFANLQSVLEWIMNSYTSGLKTQNVKNFEAKFKGLSEASIKGLLIYYFISCSELRLAPYDSVQYTWDFDPADAWPYNTWYVADVAPSLLTTLMLDPVTAFMLHFENESSLKASMVNDFRWGGFGLNANKFLSNQASNPSIYKSTAEYKFLVKLAEVVKDHDVLNARAAYTRLIAEDNIDLDVIGNIIQEADLQIFEARIKRLSNRMKNLDMNSLIRLIDDDRYGSKGVSILDENVKFEKTGKLITPMLNGAKYNMYIDQRGIYLFPVITYFLAKYL